jgi:predicted MPP superfamily phosphohydrolase
MRKWYPGMEGGPLHRILLALDVIERIPPVILGILLGLATLAAGWLLQALGVASGVALAAGLTLAAAIAVDWVLLAALPQAGRSYGPVKPPLVILAGLRAAANLGLGLLSLADLPEPWAIGLLAVAQLCGTLLAVRGFWIEPQTLTVTRHTLVSDKLAPDAPALRVLHLADIHMERITERDREVVRQAQALQPEVIVFTGDFLNLSRIYDREAWAALREMLGALRAPLGVYVVTGTPAVDQPEVVPRLLDGLNVRWLRDERVVIGQDGRQVEIVGLACTHIPEQDAPRLAALVDGTAPDYFTLLLYHSPDLAPDAARLGVDLQLSGHTHGGQVRLPWYGALYASSIYGKRFEMGLRQVEAMRLFVSRGIGMEGKGAPRVRFLCPPEIALFEIRGMESQTLAPPAGPGPWGRGARSAGVNADGRG